MGWAWDWDGTDAAAAAAAAAGRAVVGREDGTEPAPKQNWTGFLMSGFAEIGPAGGMGNFVRPMVGDKVDDSRTRCDEASPAGQLLPSQHLVRQCGVWYSMYPARIRQLPHCVATGRQAKFSFVRSGGCLSTPY
ncbi:hypothetical protein JDV02_001463 [Purpureocillium takamizusanense]|uniref:Uncharacterized protein n=1 Tax=Purpureocillium takamizusanense TaxID=2060973 RepID=A0A9Q8V7K2_9HYPO|nr:uncharacterized protein JDV02_001463 [Purpureocillium takamizusanense]UNI14882.1 hypothetical protein JDV02_001463 [Purpureocillium takamizusanense]